MNDIVELRNKLERKKGTRDQMQKEVNECINAINKLNDSLVAHKEAKELITEVGIKTQSELSFHISDVVTLAIESVFPYPYRFGAEFIQRRNKTECDLFLEDKNKNRINPIMATGGGVVDVVSFALRSSSWSMQIPRTRPILILDEPFKHLSNNLMEYAGAMIKEISEKMNLQIIMVSHEEALIDCADKVFKISKNKKGESKIKEEIV